MVCRGQSASICTNCSSSFGVGTTALEVRIGWNGTVPIWSMTLEMNVPGVIQVFFKTVDWREMRNPNESYWRFQEVEEWCQLLAETHPEWVSLDAIGNTREGRTIWMLTLGRNPKHDTSVVA